MKLRKLHKIKIGHTMPGDEIVLSHTDENGVQRTLVRDTVGRTMNLTEAAILDVEPGDFEGVTGGIGGAFLEVAKGDGDGR